jgi:hypothetical protein
MPDIGRPGPLCPLLADSAEKVRSIACKIARNIDPAPKVSQHVDFVAEDGIFRC